MTITEMMLSAGTLCVKEELSLHSASGVLGSLIYFDAKHQQVA